MTIFLKKVWSWIKHYWYFPVIITLVLLLLFLRPSSVDKLFKLMSRQREMHKREVDLLNETAEQKKEKTKRLLESHKETLEEIERKHRVKIEELHAEKKQEVAEIVKKYENRPEALAEEIAKILSAEYLKKNKKEEE